MAAPRVIHRRIDVDGVGVFHRESVPDRADAPVLLPPHGFPSASHQFRRLIDALGAHFRLISPDYPGFGSTEAPADLTHSFDRLADTVEGFVRRIGPLRFVRYVFDFGAPVGLRLALRRPELIAGLTVQNGSAYAEGLSPAARESAAPTPDTPGAQRTIRGLLTSAATRSRYETGTTAPRSSLPRAGCWTGTSSTCRAARRPRSPWPRTTATTSPPTPGGRTGCADTPRPH
ncbi:alpha/beta fold hydrolase [Thermobifida halotolerans]|uniref:alpha/beta fold hydrolase n=1 Tax=Thermobifida halotolerans TaxID=483545 RepID=UPI000B1A06A0|nr:alpha/beta fold hydrolase [Thermobifida halotolerans]